MLDFQRLWQRLGPGFVTGTSDDDPSAIGTYAQTGAQFGPQQLWAALFTFPLMAAIQEMCGRIGIVTGEGLSSVIRRHYARPVLYAVVAIQVATNTINIGADLSAMADACRLVWPLPYAVWLGAITAFTVPVIVLVPYVQYAKYLKFLGLLLASYIAAAFTVRVDWPAVLRATLVPAIQPVKAYWLNIVAVLGTTISPYEFFWQAGEEVEELPTGAARRGHLAELVAAMRADTIFGMFFSNLVMYFIILTAAFALAPNGIREINTAADAAQALRPLAGPLAFGLFTAGIISSGLLAIPVMAASSAYAVCGATGWQQSLERPFREEPRFYGIIIASSILGLLVNASGIPPFKLLYYTAVLNGVISPPLLWIVIRIAGNRRIMGHHANGPVENTLGWLIFAAATLSLCALAYAGFTS